MRASESRRREAGCLVFRINPVLCNGPAGAYRQLFDLKEIGGIPSKGAYDPRSKLAKLPFNGAKFSTMALQGQGVARVDGILFVSYSRR